jgi:hypothetical protein
MKDEKKKANIKKTKHKLNKNEEKVTFVFKAEDRSKISKEELRSRRQKRIVKQIETMDRMFRSHPSIPHSGTIAPGRFLSDLAREQLK